MRSTIFKNRRFIIGIFSAAAIAVIASGLSSSSVNARVFGLFGVAAVEQRTDNNKSGTPGTDAPFTAGNLLAIRADSATANNTTATVLEVDPLITNTSPVQSIAVLGTGTDAIRVSGSATSTLYAGRSDDGSRFTFTGHNNTNTSSNANTLNPRAPVVFLADGTYSLPTTYTGTSGNQTRGATTLNNTNWFIADQSGIYTNGSTSASPSGNYRGIKAFGGVVYVGQQSSTAANIQVSTVSAPSGGTVTGLPGLTNNANFQDFYLIQSGSSGALFDVLYIVRNTSATAGTIEKYSFVSPSWVSNGTYTTTFGGFSMAARRNGSGGAFIWVTTGTGATAANRIVRLTDTAGYNAAISITTGDNLDVYTAPAGTTLKGVDFAPASETLTVVKAGTGTGTVTSSGPGINCGGTCSANFPQDTIITLTATADPGSTFTGWSGGGCSGTGTCTVTLSSATSVTATFDLSATPPTVTTSAATGLTTTSATLNGTANPNGFAATGWFRYSTVNPGTCNDSFGTRAPASGGSPLGSGSSPVGFTENISGLSPGTTYYFCAIADNTGGAAFGSVLSFTTLAGPEVQFDAAVIREDEAQSIEVGVIRTGDTSGTSSVDVEIYNPPARPGAKRSAGGPAGEGTLATPATAGADCSTAGVDIEFGGPVTLTFAPGETYQSITMPLCSDLIDEGLEYIEFTLTDNVNTDVGTPFVVTVYINDTANQWFNFSSIGLPSSGDPPAEYPSEITVTGAPTSIGSIRVTLFDVWLSDPTDLEVMLRGPNGVMYVLMADTGGTSPILSSDAVTLTFRDSAASIISPTAAPTTGVYLPTTCGTAGPFPAPAPSGTYNLPGCSTSRTVAEALFGSFGLTDGNGTWQLYVRGDNGAPLGPEGLSGEIAGWGLELLAPTAAGVEVSGRVLTPDGRGLRNATVTMTDGQGVIRTAVTSSFGYYRFEGVPVGDSFVMSVNSRSYRFVPRVINVVDNMTDVDFVGLE